MEIADSHRFTGATVGAYLGLVPTERSSGEKKLRSSITKAGNTHAHRLLVEAAWHHRRPLKGANGRRRGQREAASPTARSRARERAQPKDDCTRTGSAVIGATSCPQSAPWPSPVNSPAGAGASPPSTTDILLEPEPGRTQARTREERSAKPL